MTTRPTRPPGRPPCPARLLALAEGKKRYTPLMPCIQGHTERYTSTGRCGACDNGWKKRNRQTVNKTAAEYRENNRQKHREYYADFYKKNRDRVLAKRRRSNAADPDAVKIKWRNWIDSNPERAKAANLAAQITHRTKKAGNGGHFTAKDRDALFLAQNGRCAVCPRKGRLEVDHVIPVCRGGSSNPSNLQLLCRSCNASKGKRTMEEWLL